MAAPKLAHELPSVERLQEVLRFDLDAGRAFWRVSNGGRLVGSEAKSPHRSGYIYVQVDGARFSLHRAIWAVANGRWPESTIDHRDGNTLNNAISNLRAATLSENCLNRKQYKNNSSGAVGVSRRSGGKWGARIGKGGKSLFLGSFDTKEAAAEAYRAAAAKIHGDFSRHT